MMRVLEGRTEPQRRATEVELRTGRRGGSRSLDGKIKTKSSVLLTGTGSVQGTEIDIKHSLSQSMSSSSLVVKGVGLHDIPSYGTGDVVSSNT